MINSIMERQSRELGYERASFLNDWGIEFSSYHTRRGFEVAVMLAIAEGAPLHAKSLMRRLRCLPKNARYHVGRLANGCQFAEVLVS
jgi:hypothetical protein